MGSEEPMLLKDSGCDMQVQRFGYKQKLAQRNFTKRFMTMALAVSHDVGPGGLSVGPMLLWRIIYAGTKVDVA